MIRLRLNGQEIQTQEGHSLLQAARENGIFIPTLCDYPGVEARGGCRMCIVEVKGRNALPTACTTPAVEGMEVETDTAQLRELRNDLLRMLLADHPTGCLFCPETSHCAECMVTLRKASLTTGCRSCPADHQCEFQTLVDESALKSVAYPVRYRALQAETNDPFFDRDYNLCILCGRCVRVCETLHFNNIPVFTTRGSETAIGVEFGLTHLEAGCSFCGGCVDACPTGTLMEKTRKWDGPAQRSVRTTCPWCSIGCAITLDVSGGDYPVVLGARPGEGASSLCVLGRFGIPEVVNSPDRLRQPLQITAGERLGLDRILALEQVVTLIQGTPQAEIGILVGSGRSDEELDAVLRFAETCLPGAGILTAGELEAGERADEQTALLSLSQPLQRLEHADLIACLGLDVQYAQSVVEPFLVRAKARGAKLLTMRDEVHVPGRFADLCVHASGERAAAMLDLISSGMGEEKLAEFQHSWEEARDPVLLVGPFAFRDAPAQALRFLERLGGTAVVLPAQPVESQMMTSQAVQRPAFPQAPKLLFSVAAGIPAGLPAGCQVVSFSAHQPVESTRDLLTLPIPEFSEQAGSRSNYCGEANRFHAAVAAPAEALTLEAWFALMGEKLSGAEVASGNSSPIARHESIIVAGQQNRSVPAWLKPAGFWTHEGRPLAHWVRGLRQIPAFAPAEEEPVHV